MSYETNERGVVELLLPRNLARLVITPDETTATGFSFTLAENDAGLTLDQFMPALARATLFWQLRMNRPGYEPSPLFALAQEVEREIVDSQIVSVPALPDEPPDVIY